MKKIIFVACIVIAVIFIFLTAGIYLFNHQPVSVDCTNCDDQGQVSPFGAMVFEFSRDVQPTLVESSWYTKPEISGYLEWIDSEHVRWKSENPVPSTQSFHFSFNAVTFGAKGEKLRNETSWELEVREPEILILATESGYGQEIYRTEGHTGPDFIQLTFTQGSVIDYSASTDGEIIVFSSMSDNGGYDLWQVKRDGSDTHKILDCENARCSSATLSPSGQQVAYIRETTAEGYTETSLRSEVWLLTLASSETKPLLADSNNSGFNPTWSPDGKWLSFWNGNLEQIYIVNTENGQVLTLESSNGDTGCWSANSEYLYYPNLSFRQAEFHHVIQRADWNNGTIETILGGQNDSDWLSYDNPECNPISETIAVAIQPNIKIPGKEIAVIDVNSKEKSTVIKDLTKIPSYLSWSPSGDQLLFQMSSLDNDQNVSIWIWDQPSSELILLMENAHSPVWLP